MTKSNSTNSGTAASGAAGFLPKRRHAIPLGPSFWIGACPPPYVFTSFGRSIARVAALVATKGFSYRGRARSAPGDKEGETYLSVSPGADPKESSPALRPAHRALQHPIALSRQP